MKHKLVFLLAVLCFPWTVWCQDLGQPYYYYKGEKVMLNYNPNFLFISGTDTKTAKSTNLTQHALIEEQTAFKTDITTQTLQQPENLRLATTQRYWSELSLRKNTLTRNDYNREIAQFKRANPGLVIAPYFKSETVDKIGLSNYFYVKLKTQDDFNILMKVVAQHKVELIGHNQYLPLWFTLSVTPDSPNALEMANTFYETGLFACAEPDLMTDDRPLDMRINDNNLTPNDPLYTNQWHLNNTGQFGGIAGFDINAEAAWDLETGNSNIVTAIIDHGFEMDHPDLIDNTFGTGYDTESNTTPAKVLGRHGTPCSGIIAAKANNNTGVSGVAFNSSIMSISNSLLGHPNSRQRRADGINWAVANGADIISNSWGSGVEYTVIDDAIANAVTNGRNGLGTIVIFASGNDNPGVGIQTTDRQGAEGYNGTDYIYFNGTSSACPIVAGVAALVLSANPSLTGQEVKDLLMNTAQKTRADSYQYDSIPTRPNGTWNNRMGHGLVDAHAALLSALEPCTTDLVLADSVLSKQTRTVQNNIISTQQLETEVDVVYKAGNLIVLKPGFIAGDGVNFLANMASCTPNIIDNPTAKTLMSVEETTYSIVESSNRLPQQESVSESGVILRCFPNPFSTVTTIEYKLITDTEITLNLFDVNGKLLKSIDQEVKVAGTHQLSFRGDDLPQGVYYLKLNTGHAIKTTRLIVSR